MKSYSWIWLPMAFVLTILCHGLAATDNGNHFDKSWSADLTIYKGDQGKGLVAFAGTDIDQDGKKEFFVFDKVLGFTAWDAILCFEAVGDNNFKKVWEQKYAREVDDEGHGIALADLDEDNRQELLVCAEDRIFIYEWDGATFESGGGLPMQKTQEFFPIMDSASKARIRQLRVTNLDADPEVELFMGYYGRTGMYCAIASLPNKDLINPNWKDEYMDPFDPWRMGGLEIGDFDGDGNMEIFTSNFQDAPTTRLYESNGADTYHVKFTTLPENLVLIPTFDDAFANPVFHDFDGDGNKEFVLTDTHGKVFVITKAASNNFEDFGPTAWKYLLTMPDVQMGGFVRSGFLGDLDQDGKPDIYYNDFTAKGVLDLEYQGGPVDETSSWIGYKIYTGHSMLYGHVYPAGDLDGDGKGELVIAGTGNPTANLQIIESQDVTSVQNKNDIVSGYILRQNYPNPFNPSTEISYALPKSAAVQLDVISVLGQRVARLVDSVQTAGTYQVHFNASTLSAGVYLFRLTADEFIEQKKMVLLK
ncbi:T9SS type A sorting domain-containing protein [bacterium]|nr:T9SS type A sorting domain-containing protein [bacterium]